MDTIDLSVIIPVYNLERWIEPMLNSLKEQKLGKYKVEYIFVFNNCTDRSEDIVRESGLPCKILYCTEHQSCGSARNVGFEIAQGEYIWFMDGDDWLIGDDVLLKVLNTVTENEYDIYRVQYESDNFNMLWFAMVWQYIFKKSYIDEFRFPDIQPCEDDMFMDMVFAKAGLSRDTYLRLPHTDYAYYFYRYGREGSNMWRVHRGEKI